ncbi:hypothetical protein AHAS_Ahas15G0242400 [Arachis hypogaea]
MASLTEVLARLNLPHLCHNQSNFVDECDEPTSIEECGMREGLEPQVEEEELKHDLPQVDEVELIEVEVVVEELGMIEQEVEVIKEESKGAEISSLLEVFLPKQPSDTPFKWVKISSFVGNGRSTLNLLWSSK